MNDLPDLLEPKDVKRHLKLKTKTNHTLRALELRGLLHPVRINARTLRYRPEDVAKLIEQSRGAA